MPPETGAYLILALLAVVVMLGALATSFVVRQRNLDRDLALLQQIVEGED